MMKEALLGLLAKGPAHGYDLKISLEQVLGRTSKVNVGQVYTALAKLEKEGLVTADRVAREQGTDMKVYALTASGQAELEHWFALPVERVELRDELFIKLSLARRTGRSDVTAIIRAQRKAYLEAIGELTALRTRYEEEQADEIGLLVENAILHLEADLRWLELWEQHRRT
ncbi:MAG: PadR family transcriptional regulator [Mycobacterium leprae]